MQILSLSLSRIRIFSLYHSIVLNGFTSADMQLHYL